MDEIDKRFKVLGPEASDLRRRKYRLQRQHGLADLLLPGSLTRALRRCGKPRCRCVAGEGHPVWIFSYSVAGRRRSMTVPLPKLGALQELLEARQAYDEAVAEVMQINVRLFELWRRERRLARGRKKVTDRRST